MTRDYSNPVTIEMISEAKLLNLTVREAAEKYGFSKSSIRYACDKFRIYLSGGNVCGLKSRVIAEADDTRVLTFSASP